MKRIFFLILINMFACMSGAAFAEATSFEMDGRTYNLVVYDKDEYEQPVSFLRKTLEELKIFGSLQDCSMIIDVPVGTAHGNHSYGGVCKVRHENMVYPMMICADEMVGQASLQISWWTDDRGLRETSDKLSAFVARNCTGG